MTDGQHENDHANEHFAVLREQEAERNRDRDLAGEPQVEDQPTYEEGQEPGHLGNDLSRMTLLDTDLEQIAKDGTDDREANEDVQQALRDLNEIDTGEFPD